MCRPGAGFNRLNLKQMLKMDFVLSIAEALVPSTEPSDPYTRVFFDVGSRTTSAERTTQATCLVCH